MIYFIKQLYDEAVRIMELKSTTDDLKAAKDFAEINNVLNKEFPLDVQCTYEIKLHKRINAEYSEIEWIEKVASKVTLGVGKKNQKSYTLFEGIKQDLLRDAYGICASILLKHRKIKAVEDFIERID